MTAVVLDASVALSWCFADEATPATEDVLRRVAAGSFVVPGLWFTEFANALLMGERRGRITAEKSTAAFVMLSSMACEVDPVSASVVFGRIAALARTHLLTVYDATYLELAIRRELPLATTDKALRTAARGCGVQLLGVAA